MPGRPAATATSGHPRWERPDVAMAGPHGRLTDKAGARCQASPLEMLKLPGHLDDIEKGPRPVRVARHTRTESSHGNSAPKSARRALHFLTAVYKFRIHGHNTYRSLGSDSAILRQDRVHHGGAEGSAGAGVDVVQRPQLQDRGRRRRVIRGVKVDAPSNAPKVQ